MKSIDWTVFHFFPILSNAYHLIPMNNLSFEAFCKIYKDQATEAGYEEYQRVINQIKVLISPVVSDASEVSVSEIEKTLSLKTFSELEMRGHLTKVSSILLRFSPYAENDPNTSALKLIESVFKNNPNLHENFKKKLSKIINHFETHPLRKKISTVDGQKMRETIISTYFSSDRSVKQVKGIINLDDNGFFSVIEEILKEKSAN